MVLVSAVRRSYPAAARSLAAAPALAAAVLAATVFLIVLAGASPLRAQEAGIAATHLTPVVTIFPGDVISEDMVTERSFSQLRPLRAGYATSPQSVIGKVARRTLMPGFAIPHNAVENAKLVQKGVPTQMIFEEGGLTITTLVEPLQAGELNAAIRARNLDSGLIVHGVVQANGTLRAAGGG